MTEEADDAFSSSKGIQESPGWCRDGGGKAIAVSDPRLHFPWLRSVGLRNPHCGLAEHVPALAWPCYDFALCCHSLALIQTTCPGMVSCLERNQSNKARGVGRPRLF